MWNLFERWFRCFNTFLSQFCRKSSSSWYLSGDRQVGSGNHQYGFVIAITNWYRRVLLVIAKRNILYLYFAIELNHFLAKSNYLHEQVLRTPTVVIEVFLQLDANGKYLSCSVFFIEGASTNKPYCLSCFGCS